MWPSRRTWGTEGEASLVGVGLAASISAFFPAYNDAWTIASLIVTTDRLLRSRADDYEIIVVDDGSPDHVAEILSELQARYAHLRVVSHPRNRGYGGALRSGFAAAHKDLVFYTDGDAQYDPRELTLLLDRLADGVDVVNGYKLCRSDGIHRRVIGELYQRTVRAAFGLPIRDVDCDFRLFRRHVFDVVQLESDSGVITVELVKKIHDAGFRFAEAPVHHHPRAAGRSQFFRLRPVVQTLRDLACLWWHLRGNSQHREGMVLRC
jgi:glycosyltransferase involved in cell wall biosynthesis